MKVSERCPNISDNFRFRAIVFDVVKEERPCDDSRNLCEIANVKIALDS